jgi:hypothetical protein
MICTEKREIRYLDGPLVEHVNVDSQVPEGLAEGSSGSLDGNDPGLDAEVNAIRSGDGLVGVQHFHRGELVVTLLMAK